MTSSYDDDLNPYQSSRYLDSQYVVAWDPGAKLESNLVKTETLYRRVRLTGRLEADVVWNAFAVVEYVSVNGKTMVAKHAFFRSIPYFEFELPAAGHRIRMTVEVRVAWFYWTKAFRITVNHEVAYSEGDWSGRDWSGR